jgi:hypothetical protein
VVSESRLLIAVGQTAESADQLPFGVRELIAAADEVLVVAPVLPTRFEWLASATDKAREQADERLRSVLGQLDELGSEPSGALGSDDPLQAFEDAIRHFSPTHVLIGLRDDARRGWQERGLLEALLERVSVPITVFQLSA